MFGALHPYFPTWWDVCWTASSTIQEHFSSVKKSNYKAYARRNVGHFESTVETPVMHALPPIDPGGPRGITHYGGQSEPAPTCAPMWMDGVLMGGPFSSLPVPELTKVLNSSWPFFSFPQPRFFWELFFPHPPHPPGSHLPSYI